MADSKHTPGPWNAGRCPANDSRWRIYGSEWNGSEVYRYRTAVASTANWLSTDPAEEVEANAHLIAAAPELLEAAKRALPVMIDNLCGGEPYDPGDQEATWALADAIAKAEGK